MTSFGYTPNLFACVWTANNKRQMKIFLSKAEAERECQMLVSRQKYEISDGGSVVASHTDIELVTFDVSSSYKLPGPYLPASVTKVLEALQELSKDQVPNDLKFLIKYRMNCALDDDDEDCCSDEC